MAQVATRAQMLPASKPPLFSGSIDGGCSKAVGTGIKRKTPSDMRGEQLKRKNVIEIMDESPAPELGSMQNANGPTFEPTKPIIPRNPRYIDKRVDELFPSRKNNLRSKMLSGKENVKVAAVGQPSGPNYTCPSTLKTQSHKNSISKFRNVVELSTGGDKSTEIPLDMDEAFRGLAARAPPSFPVPLAEAVDRNTTNFCSEFHIHGQKTPLDFTLKTSMRVIASSSVNWLHRLMSCGTFNGFGQSNCTSAQIYDSNALYSWVYPQSSLPPAVISAITLSAKGEGQTDFLTKRQFAWEASFRSLYVMLRKNSCNLFYVCTGQFVAMFTSSNDSTSSKNVCRAYVSQSTRTFRSLLKEQDISFTMPLCHSKVEQVTTEDLFELSEIEKYNLGETRRTVPLSDVDNSPESLLAFCDVNVHGLYDFLLNYRFLLPSLNIYDVPLLYSPVPFENAAVSAPEVKCKEVKKIDYMSNQTTTKPNHGSASTTHYTVEIKDAYLPPWITSSVCDALRSNGDKSFETSFVTEPMSIGLNIGLDTVCQKSDSEDTKFEDLQEPSCPFGVKNTIVSHHLSRGFLKGLKFSDDSCTVSLLPV
ncbi:uncharacterized protein [Rutidosis leptorrhynchoides]|uniref:uncharacterized protein n=1 Tax=Rutidosis leptorrhynchoides TaxID=125765 RepID=UPI003A993C4E